MRNLYFKRKKNLGIAGCSTSESLYADFLISRSFLRLFYVEYYMQIVLSRDCLPLLIFILVHLCATATIFMLYQKIHLLLDSTESSRLVREGVVEEEI